DRHLRLVVDELAALVEKRGVVLVALDDEPLTLGEPRAFSKVLRDPADQEAWLPPAVLENPGQQRRGRRLAMRARDHERAPALNEELAEERRQGRVRKLPLE